MVLGFYENRHPFTRKEFQAARVRAEIRVNNLTKNQPEMAQASMETNEGIIIDINAKYLPITNDDAINDKLFPKGVINSNSPTIVQVLAYTNNKGGGNKEAELISCSITSGNLVDIQINEIDADLAKYDKDLIVIGSLVKAINAMSNPEDHNQIPPIKSRDTRKSSSNHKK